MQIDRTGFTVLDRVTSRAFLGDEKFKKDQLEFMRLQNRSREDVAKWIKYYNEQYSPDMQKKRQQICDLIKKSYARGKNQGVTSPAWNAVVSNDLQKIKLLWTEGKISNINMQNNKGETLLILAVRNGRYDIAKFLLSQNAKIGIIDKEKETGKK